MKTPDLDYNLLAVFEAFYEERHQKRTADRLGVTQPTISNSLARLRELTGDPLFEGTELRATPTADQFYARVHPGLEQVRRLLLTRQRFNPATTTETFTLAVDHGGGALRLQALYRRLATQAPRARLRGITLDHPDDLPDRLRRGAADVAVTHAPVEHVALINQPAGAQPLRLISRADHPRLGAGMSLAALKRERFALIHQEPPNLDDPANASLRQLLAGRVQVEVTAATVLCAIVAESELVALASRDLAERLAPRFGLRVWEPPFAYAKVPTYLVWHQRQTWQPAQTWFRQVVSELWGSSEPRD